MSWSKLVLDIKSVDLIAKMKRYRFNLLISDFYWSSDHVEDSKIFIENSLVVVKLIVWQRIVYHHAFAHMYRLTKHSNVQRNSERKLINTSFYSTFKINAITSDSKHAISQPLT